MFYRTLTPLLERVIGDDYNIVPLSPRTAKRGFWETIGIQGLLILHACLNLHQPYVDHQTAFIRLWVEFCVLGIVRPWLLSSHADLVLSRTARMRAL